MNPLLYRAGHMACFNYDDKEDPLVLFTDFEKGKSIAGEMLRNRIIFILSGEVVYRVGNKKSIPVKSGNMLFIPSGEHTTLTALKKSRIVMMYLENLPDICECFDGTNDELVSDTTMNMPSEVMEIHPRVKLFLSTFRAYFEDGIRCRFYLRTKVKEMYYYMGAYYEKRRIKLFFSLVGNTDKEFSAKITANWQSFKAAKEMADFMNSSYSAFVRRFKTIFGISPGKWLREKRKEAVFNDLSATDESLKVLSEKHLFSSQSYLGDFCQHHFGMSPGEIRKNKGRKK